MSAVSHRPDLLLPPPLVYPTSVPSAPLVPPPTLDPFYYQARACFLVATLQILSRAPLVHLLSLTVIGLHDHI